MTDDILILSAPPPEHWDESLAQDLVGKIMLVNLTFLDAEGEVEGREAFYGVVITADAEEGILLNLLGPQDGDTTTLPPQTSNISSRRAGPLSADRAARASRTPTSCPAGPSTGRKSRRTTRAHERPAAIRDQAFGRRVARQDGGRGPDLH